MVMPKVKLQKTEDKWYYQWCAGLGERGRIRIQYSYDI